MLDAYLAGEIWTSVKNDNRFANLTAKTFGVFEAPTRATHGFPNATAAV